MSDSKEKLLELNGFKVGDLVTYHSPPSGPASSGPHKILELRIIGEEPMAFFKGRAGYVKLVTIRHYDGPADGRPVADHLKERVNALLAENGDLEKELVKLGNAYQDQKTQNEALSDQNELQAEKIALLEERIEALENTPAGEGTDKVPGNDQIDG